MIDSSIKLLNFDSGDSRYPIYIGHGLLKEPSYFEEILHNRRCAIVTDKQVASLYLAQIKKTLPVKNSVEIVLPAGETSKTFASVENICGKLLQSSIDRSGMLIALGGGVVGDITGFAAACYQRGVDFIQLPTTLLAQVDASVGGKTGVNHVLGKNMIGAFHQPRAVIIDLETLNTLPARQIAAGTAEIIKYGLIIDAGFFSWLEKNITEIQQLKTQPLGEAIYRSCEIKAEIVVQDQYEKTGLRMLLNLGHTFGHAIETGLGHGSWLHGEAVGCGMALAAQFSERRNLISADDTTRIMALIRKARLPIKLPGNLNALELTKLMQRDKKNLGGKQHLILLKKIGEAFVDKQVPVTEIESFLSTLRT